MVAGGAADGDIDESVTLLLSTMEKMRIAQNAMQNKLCDLLPGTIALGAQQLCCAWQRRMLPSVERAAWAIRQRSHVDMTFILPTKAVLVGIAVNYSGPTHSVCPTWSFSNGRAA